MNKRFFKDGRQVAGVRLFHDFKLEIELFPPTDHREIELPKLPRKTERRPALIEVHDKLNAECPPEICQTDVRGDRAKFFRGVERKWSLRRNKASERITVEVIAMRRIGGPIRIRVVRRENLQFAARLRDAM